MAEPAALNPGWRKSSYSDNGGSDCVEVGAWRKSSYSSNGGSDCGVAGKGGTGKDRAGKDRAGKDRARSGGAGTASAVAGVLVRDTTDRAGATLTISAAAWRILVAGLRA
jgi:hypothetical protein